MASIYKCVLFALFVSLGLSSIVPTAAQSPVMDHQIIVKDAVTGVPQQGIAVRLREITAQAPTDENGVARFNDIPQNNYHVDVFFYGASKSILASFDDNTILEIRIFTYLSAITIVTISTSVIAALLLFIRWQIWNRL